MGAHGSRVEANGQSVEANAPVVCADGKPVGSHGRLEGTDGRMVRAYGPRVGTHKGVARALDPVMSGPLHWPGDYRLCAGEARGGGGFFSR